MGGDTLTRRKRGQSTVHRRWNWKAKGLMTKEGWVVLEQSAGSGICPLSYYYLSSPQRWTVDKATRNPSGTPCNDF